MEDSWRLAMDRLRELIVRFHEGQIPASEFERLYLSAFKAGTAQLPEPVFEALNELFLDVDAYCGDPALRDADDIDEATLRERAAKTLTAIQGCDPPRQA